MWLGYGSDVARTCCGCGRKSLAEVKGKRFPAPGRQERKNSWMTGVKMIGLRLEVAWIWRGSLGAQSQKVSKPESLPKESARSGKSLTDKTRSESLQKPIFRLFFLLSRTFFETFFGPSLSCLSLVSKILLCRGKPPKLPNCLSLPNLQKP